MFAGMKLISEEELLTKGAEILGERAYQRLLGDLPLVVREEKEHKAAFIAQARDDLKYFVLPALAEWRKS